MNRKSIKERAKEALRFRYWPIVGIELIAGVLIGGVSGVTNISRFNNDGWKDMMDNVPYAKEIMATVASIAAVAAIVGLLYAFLFGNVIQVGISGIRLKAYEKEFFQVKDLFSGLKAYWKNVGTMALYTLFIALGLLCFIVPGIIVALGLFEVPFLLADGSEVSGMAAIRRSWEDMKGYKGKLFVLALSFIGWGLLSALTCGVLAVFYTGPYIALSEAGFYRERQQLRAAEQPKQM